MRSWYLPRPPVDPGPVGDAAGIGARRHGLHEGEEALMGDAVEAAQLGQRLGVIVHAQVEHGIGLAAPDLDGGGLLAALVAALRLPGIERRHEALREGQVHAPPVGLEGRLDHGGTCQHVARHRDALVRRDVRTSRCIRRPVWAAVRPSRSMTWSWRELAARIAAR